MACVELIGNIYERCDCAANTKKKEENNSVTALTGAQTAGAVAIRNTETYLEY
jgi:hypothetical protein